MGAVKSKLSASLPLADTTTKSLTGMPPRDPVGQGVVLQFKFRVLAT